MRISDWSSDVCSSDLGRGVEVRRGSTHRARRLERAPGIRGRRAAAPADLSHRSLSWHRSTERALGFNQHHDAARRPGGRQVKFGLMFANIGPMAPAEGALAIGQAAAEAGFESLWAVEHTVVPAGYQSQYPYSDDGRMPGGEDFDIPDPLLWLTYFAA